MVVLHLETVLKITQPTPFSYQGKTGMVSGYECFIMGETVPNEAGGESTGLAKVTVRASTPDLLAEKVAKLKVKKGESAQIKLRLFDVGKNDMYSVNAA